MTRGEDGGRYDRAAGVRGTGSISSGGLRGATVATIASLVDGGGGSGGGGLKHLLASPRPATSLANIIQEDQNDANRIAATATPAAMAPPVASAATGLIDTTEPAANVAGQQQRGSKMSLAGLLC